MNLIEPKEVEIELLSGEKKTFILSKFPAVQGREIVMKYPLSAMPKLGDYAENEVVMLKLMSFVAVPRESGDPLRLTTKGLVDNHVGDWKALGRIEIAMLDYNTGFFADGRASAFLEVIAQKAQAWIFKTLTGLSAQSSQAVKPRSKN